MNKYLTDGRKVSVIGTINSTEFIVQEIFITKDGSEIPSGENFVAKSLHDDPVKSWQEKNMEKIKELELKAELSYKKIESEIYQKNNQLKMMKDMVKSSLESYKAINANKYTLETLSDFLSGNIEWVVFESHSIEAPIKFKDVVSQTEKDYGSVKYEGLKLITLFGKYDGNLEYRLNYYRDGSGSYQTIYPFNKYSDAILKVKDIACYKIDKGNFSYKDICLCNDLGIQFSGKHKEIIHNIIDENYKKGVEYQQDIINKTLVKIEELELELIKIKDLI
jgi:hypothetical protein